MGSLPHCTDGETESWQGMVKPRLDSGLHSEILSWDSFSMSGRMVASFPATHLPGVFPIRLQPPFHLLLHLVSLRIPKLLTCQ